MELNPRTRLALAVHHGLFVVLLLALAALLAAVSRGHHASWDWSQNARNSVSPGTRAFLEKLQGPVHITAYTGGGSPTGRAIRTFLAPYQRVKHDIHLEFVDPNEEPRRARDAGVRVEGELVVSFRDKSEHLTQLDEAGLTNLLMRLAREKVRLVLYLDGHGERKLDGEANFDLGAFGRELGKRGFKVAPLRLSLAQDVPANAALLVIAGPRVDLLASEVDKLTAWLARGGSLLWLIDPGPLHGLQALSEALGLTLPPGVVVDPAARDLKASATIAVGAAYGQHPVIGNFDLITLFPDARPLVATEEGGDWQVTPLVEVAPRGWVETGPLTGEVRFDKGRDTPGPVTVALALTRNRNDASQRVVVVGSGAFLSNTFVHNGGNLDLGLNMVNWLAQDEALISIQPRPTRDAELALSRGATLAIAAVFLLLLPLGFLSAGALVWWRRRRA